MAHSSDGRADRTWCSSDEDRNINTLQQQSVQTHLMSINDFLTVTVRVCSCWFCRSWSASDASAVFLVCWRSPFSLDLLKGSGSSDYTEMREKCKCEQNIECRAAGGKTSREWRKLVHMLDEITVLFYLFVVLKWHRCLCEACSQLA